MGRPTRAGTTRTPSEKTVAYRISAGVVIPLIQAVARFDLRNTANVPREGGFILAPNHYSELDPLIVGTIVYRLGRAPHFLAKASLFHLPLVGAAMRGMHHVPVERSGRGRGAVTMKDATALADRGHCVIVYPEGTLTRDPDLWPMRGKTGAVRLALESGLPILPAAHWGAQQILPRYSKRARLFGPRKRVSMAFGEPMDLTEYRGRPIDQRLLIEATEEVMREITRLLATIRGGEPPAERWNPVEHQQSETGRF